MRSPRAFVIGLVVTALSCGGGALGGPGTGAAGTSAGGRGGSGGTAAGGTAAGGSDGGTVTGGSGGASGLPACDPGTPLVVGGTISANGAALKAPVTATITVTDRVTDAGAAVPLFILKSTTTSEEWNWDMAIPDLPTDLIKVGDTFDLTVNAGETTWAFSTYTFQTVVLSRDGVLVAFTSNLWNQGTLPPLAAWGIFIFDAGLVCEIPASGGFCGYRHHIADVAAGGTLATVAEGQTVTIDGLSFSLGNFVDPFVEVGNGSCHEARRSSWAGFRR